MLTIPRSIHRTALLLFFMGAVAAQAQVAPTVPIFEQNDPVARLEDQLVTQLHATLPSQRAYIHHIVTLIDQKKLETRLVIAVQRYAMRRNARYPFPFFERALNYQARKEGIILPDMQHFQTAAAPNPEAFQ